MKVDSWPVTKEHGPRPAGKPDECFYCRKPIGVEHATRCVMRTRTVVVEARIQYVIHVPELWTGEDIESHRNDGSWCSDNGLDEIAAIGDMMEDRREKDVDGVPYCFCSQTEYKYVREATVEDERNNGVYAGIDKQ